MGLCLLALLLPGLNVTARPLARNSRPSPSDVVDEVNSLRAAHGLPPYGTNSILMGTAQGQADYMASTGIIGHTGPGGSSVTSRLLAAGYPLAGDLSLGGLRSENVVGGPGMSASGAVSIWTGDSPHLNTMLSPNLQDIGAGVAEKDGMIYYVIDCAAPTGGSVVQFYTPGAAEAALSGGDDLIMPVKMSTPDSNGDIVHEVQAGQSLWQIAIAYGVKIADIQRLNNLGPSLLIYRGNKLLIKHAGTPTPAAATETETAVPDTETATPMSIDTPTQLIEATVTTIPAAPVSGTGAGWAVAAIAGVALLSAGFVAWAGRSRTI